ncbi:cytochrome b-c1 complex subunit 2, mitochondrial-like [Mercenaria mercenaria]|uniref:cytochrome b-c1 complex subunit 2, mitochondrial-like n=1 Tax=Mercenaria mercenaria TaxID=6596 RepID=UPI00234E434C|nr:cytochrome b-c1 complex subunit 2, mitochondrial-like [Mercenaria mercenaria]
MSSPMSRALCRSLKGRFYSAQAMRKPDASSSEITSARVNGVNVATADSLNPLSRVTFVVKGGSRYEDPSNFGVSHVIRHIAYLTNDKNSSFKTFKNLEALGANLNSITTRDYAMVSVSCTRNFMPEAFELIAPAMLRSSFSPWDWKDHQGCTPKVEFDVAALQQLPNVVLMEELHAAAYRQTLGNSLYCPPEFVGSHSPDQILAFMGAHYRPNRMAVVGTGVDNDELTQLVKGMKFQESSSQPNDKKAEYVGGERRVPRPDLDVTYAAVATEGPSLASKDLLSAAVLQQIMGLGPHIKYSDSVSGSRLATALKKATNSPFMVNGLNVNYTDSGLFGFTVAADPADMEKVLRTAFGEFASLTKTGVTDAEVTRGKYQLKTDIAMRMESGDAVVMNLAEQAVGSEKISSLNDVMNMVDSLQTSDIVNVAKKLVNGKPSMSSVGNLSNVPYLDQLLK